MKQLHTMLLSGLVCLLLLSISLPSVSAAAPEGAAEQSKTLTGVDHGPHAHRHGRCHSGPIMRDAAKLLGLEPKILVQQLKQGKTLLQIAHSSKGWSEAELVKKLTESATLRIDQALAEGRINQEKANRIKAELPDKLKRAVHRNWKDKLRSKPTTDYQNNKINWIPPQA